MQYNTRQRGNLRLQEEKEFSLDKKVYQLKYELMRRGKSSPKNDEKLKFPFKIKALQQSDQSKDREMSVEQENRSFTSYQQFLTPMTSHRKEHHKVFRAVQKKSESPARRANNLRTQNFLDTSEKMNLSLLISHQQQQVQHEKRIKLKKAQTQDIQEIYSPVSKGQKTQRYYIDNVRLFLLGLDSKNAFAQQYINHFIQQFNTLQYCRIFTAPDINYVKSRSIKMERSQFAKTVVFDLDETLIHCNEDPYAKFDFRIPVQLPTGVFFEAGINVRPYAIQVLQELSKFCEVIVFTASHSSYANKILDKLDPYQKYISYRFYREHCIQTPQGVHIKDLRIIDRDLNRIVLIDNAAYSYCLQMDNGIPIIPFTEDRNDKELLAVTEYIRSLPDDDVQTMNRETFKISQLQQKNTIQEAISLFT